MEPALGKVGPGGSLCSESTCRSCMWVVGLGQGPRGRLRVSREPGSPPGPFHPPFTGRGLGTAGSGPLHPLPFWLTGPG